MIQKLHSRISFRSRPLVLVANRNYWLKDILHIPEYLIANVVSLVESSPVSNMVAAVPLCATDVLYVEELMAAHSRRVIEKTCNMQGRKSSYDSGALHRHK